MLRFASEVGAEVSRLTVNLRSAASIASFAERVAGALGHQDDPDRPQRSYAANGEVRLEEWPDEVAEAIGVAEWLRALLTDGMPRSALAPHESVQVQPENLAVLARSAAALGAVRDELSRAGLPFSISSGPDEWLATTAARVVIELIALNNADSHRSTHWQIARLLGRQEDTTSSVSDVRHALADHADASLRMIAPLCDAKTPADMMADLDRLSDLSGGDEAWLPAWEADCRQLASAWKAFVDNVDLASQTWGNFRLHIARIQRGDDHQPGVRLLTIHKAQGREYRAVALVGLNEGQFPDFRAISEEEAAAELRTFYVAISRATRVLLLSRARQRQTRVGPRATEPSRFLRYLSHR
jgi:superfamily I DNA/RNA helicase